jgi:hypothetical protein
MLFWTPLDLIRTISSNLDCGPEKETAAWQPGGMGDGRKALQAGSIRLLTVLIMLICAQRSVRSTMGQRHEDTHTIGIGIHHIWRFRAG